MKRFRRMKKLASAAVFLMLATLVFPFMAPPALAQATTGGLKGVVTDVSGAVVPDADVTAKNVATGVENKAKTNADGLYSFARLAPGSYNLDVQKQGFKKAEFQQVGVSIGQDTSIDATLQAGQITETVTVTATGEELVQKEQAQISNTFESRKVSELPSNIAGGGIDTLALLAPGVVPGFGNVNSNGTTLSVNGQRARANNFTIDGQDNNDLSIGGPSFFVDNQDVVGEFQIITNNFSAEYGRNQGAIINIVTKAGTNAFHGTGAWYHRDRRYLDALTNIERRGGRVDPPPFLYNVFSGTVGGPIIKDRAFFFGSYQMITARATSLGQSGNPTIAAEELDRLKAAFPGNAAIATLADFSAFRLTDVGTVRERADRSRTEFIILNNVRYRVAYPEREVINADNAPEWSVRGDWKITEKDNIWYRHLHQFAPNHFGTGTISSGWLGDVPASGTHSGASYTRQISNNSVNEARFSYSRLSVKFGGGCEGKFKSCIPDPTAILTSFTNINFTGITSQRQNADGTVSSTGISLQTIGPATNLPQGRIVTAYQWLDNFSKTKGLHQFKMGVDVRRLTNSVPFLPNVNGAYRFSTTGRLINNAPTQVQLAVGEDTIAYQETDQFYYFEDNWRFKDNLTLNLVVRYEYTGQPVNTLFRLTLDRESDPATAIFKQSLPVEARIVPKLAADKNNWAPRIGFAWRPNYSGGLGKMLLGGGGDTVVRGGYAIAYDPAFYNIMLNISTSSPSVFLNTTLNPAAAPGIVFPLPSNPIGQTVQDLARANGLLTRNLFDPKFFSATIVSPNFYSPYSQQWSLGIQRPLGRNNVYEVRYVGNHAVGLFATLNRNPRVDRLLNGFTSNILTGFTPAGAAITTPVTFPGFANLLPPGITAQVAGSGACVDDPATTTLNESGACNGRLLPRSLIRSRENIAQSTYHGLQMQARGRLFNQLSYGGSYTFSKTLDNASEIFTFAETSAPQNPFNSNSAEKGLSGFHRAHASAFNFLWDIPGYGTKSGLVGRLVNGWQLNGIYYLAAGRRFTPQQFSNTGLTGYDDSTFNASFFGQDALRPFVGNPKAPKDSVGITAIDATFLFGVPATNPNALYSLNDLNKTGTVTVITKDQVRYIFNGPGAARMFNNPFGTAARGSEAGPLLNDLNLGLYKNTRIKEKITFRLSIDSFNVLNHKNPGAGFNSGGTFPTPYVEQAGQTDGFYDFNGITGARRAWQVGAKIIF